MKHFFTTFFTLWVSLYTYGQADLNDFITGQLSDKSVFLEIDYEAMLDSIDALNAALSSNETTGSDDTTESDETAEWGVYTYLKASVVGEHAEDESGWSVALSSDGQILAIGAMKNDDAGNNAGHVRVYQWDLANSEWLQRGVDIDGTSQGDGFGRSVALSADGSILAVGANGNDSFASNSGQTQVFKWDSGTWQQLGEDIYGEVAGDFSGFDVALSHDGETVAIGAPTNGVVANGSARVFSWDEGGAEWLQVGDDLIGEGAGDQFGVSLALSADGTVLAVGASMNDGTGSNAGHVRVYGLTSSNAWSQLGADLDGEMADDRSGYSVSLSSDGEKIAIGAVKNDDNGIRSGHVKVYEWDASSAAWNQLGANIPGEAAYDWSGWSVALAEDGERVAISSTYNDDNGTNAGHVRVYQWNGSSESWEQFGDDIDGEGLEDESGWCIDLSSEGDVLAIGSPGNDDNGTDSGHVRVMVAN